MKRGPIRLTLGTRVLLVLASVATISNLIAVCLQYSALSADLRRVVHAGLQRAAATASQLVDQRLVIQAERYAAVCGTPQFLGAARAADPATLIHMAGQMRRMNQAAATFFLGGDGAEIAGDGPEPLRTFAREYLAAGTRRNAVFVHDEATFAVVSTPLRVSGEPAMSVVVVEALRPAEFEAWARICHARIALGAVGDGAERAVAFRTIGTRELRVVDVSDAEANALQHSRTSLLAGGTLGLALALGASLLLARNLVRPIRSIQRAADRIGAGDVEVRLDESRNDEVGDVARSFNRMLDNLQRTVVERTRVESRVSHLAFRDSLTGLANRRLLKDQLNKALVRAREGGTKVAVVFLDLDRFKTINDSLGHGAGDTLLLDVACRLHSSVEQFPMLETNAEGGVLLARLGGDEFTLVLTDVQGREQLTALAETILTKFAVPCDVRGHEVAVHASLGIAIGPDDGEDVETLLRHSDMAMYCAKGRGGSGFEFYSDTMEEIAAKRLELETRLGLALENGELEVYYQPKVDLETNNVAGMEALLRWRGKDQQPVSPAEFVPMAEETGAIVAIGEWVLQQAIAQCAQWQRAGLPRVRVAVNVSPRQLEQRNDFVAGLERMIEEFDLDPSLLELEITESSLLEHEQAAVAIFERIRKLGVGLSLDDFGTGYSSLSYLRVLPIDTVKIDRSFVYGADDSPADVALLGSIIAMAKMLDLRVVVEGIETDEQLRLVEELGCDEFQGYLFSPAVDADQATAILMTNAVGSGRVPVLR